MVVLFSETILLLLGTKTMLLLIAAMLLLLAAMLLLLPTMLLMLLDTILRVSMKGVLTSYTILVLFLRKKIVLPIMNILRADAMSRVLGTLSAISLKRLFHSSLSVTFLFSAIKN